MISDATDPFVTITNRNIMQAAAEQPADGDLSSEEINARAPGAETPVSVTPGMPTVFSVPSVGNAMLGTGGNVQMTNPFGGMPQAPAVDVTPSQLPSGVPFIIGRGLRNIADDFNYWPAKAGKGMIDLGTGGLQFLKGIGTGL